MHPEARIRDPSHPAQAPLARALAKAESQLWHVARVRVEDGRPVVDVAHPTTAGGLAGIPLLVGGGAADRLDYTPPVVAESGRPSLVRISRREDGRLVAEAAALPQADLGFVEEQSTPKSADDHPGTPTVADRVLANGDAKVILDALGEVLVASKTMIRNQLGADGVFRVSRDGDASERVPLGFALVDFLEGLTSWLTKLSVQVQVLTTAVQAIAPTVPPYPAPGVGSLAPPQPSMQLLSAAVHIPDDALEAAETPDF